MKGADAPLQACGKIGQSVTYVKMLTAELSFPAKSPYFKPFLLAWGASLVMVRSGDFPVNSRRGIL
jgi:hypothetical protein